MAVQSTGLSKHEKRKRVKDEVYMPPLLFTRQQVAKLLNVHPITVMRMEARGKLQPVKLNAGVSARTYYRSADIYALIGRRGGDR
jgi:hypothetical protein